MSEDKVRAAAIAFARNIGDMMTSDVYLDTMSVSEYADFVYFTALSFASGSMSTMLSAITSDDMDATAEKLLMKFCDDMVTTVKKIREMKKNMPTAH